MPAPAVKVIWFGLFDVVIKGKGCGFGGFKRPMIANHFAPGELAVFIEVFDNAKAATVSTAVVN